MEIEATANRTTGQDNHPIITSEAQEPETVRMEHTRKILYSAQVQDSEGCLFQVDTVFMPRTQRSSTSNLIVVQINEKINLYQVKNKQILSFSSHVVDLPIDGCMPYWIFTTRKIRFVFEKKEIPRTPTNSQFLEENGIDWTTESRLIFESRYGDPEDGYHLPAEYIGEIKSVYGGFWNWDIIDSFDNLKPLFSDDRLTIAKTKMEGEADDPELDLLEEILQESTRWKYYLAKVTKHSPNLLKLVFNLNFDYQKLKIYKDKLESEKSVFKSHEARFVRFSQKDQQITMLNQYPGQVRRLQPFIKIDSKMLVVGLIDLRTMKIVKRGFMSVYEIFKDLDFVRVISIMQIRLNEEMYSSTLDLLSFNVIIESFHSPAFEFPFGGERERTPNQKLRERLVAGRKDKDKLTFINEDPITGTIEKFKLKVKVSDFFDVKRRMVVASPLADSKKRLGFELGDQLIHSEEGQDELRLEIMTKLLGEEAWAEGVEKEEGERGSGGLTKTLKRAYKVEVQDKISTKVVSIQKRVLPTTPTDTATAISFNNHELVEMIDSDTCLVVGARKLLLFDINTLKLISERKYTERFPLNLVGMSIQKDLIVNCDFNYQFLDIFQIMKGENELENQKGGTSGGSKIVHLKTHNLKMVENFHSIESLIGFERLPGGVYQLCLRVFMMEDPKTTMTTLQRLFLNLKVQKSHKNELNDQDNLRVSGEEVKISIDQIFVSKLPEKETREDLGYDKFYRNDSWHQVLLNENLNLEIKIIAKDNQIKFSADLPSEGLFEETDLFTNSYIYQEYLYLVFENSDPNNMMILGTSILRLTLESLKHNLQSSSNNNNQKVAPDPTKFNKKKKVLDSLRQVAFRETESTQELRIFSFNNEREQADEALNLQVLNPEMEVLRTIDFGVGLDITYSTFLDARRLYLVAKMNRTEEEEVEIGGGGGGRLKGRAGYLVDLDSLEVTRVVDDRGDPVAGVMFRCLDDGLIHFRTSQSDLSLFYFDRVHLVKSIVQ